MFNGCALYDSKDLHHYIEKIQRVRNDYKIFDEEAKNYRIQEWNKLSWWKRSSLKRSLFFKPDQYYELYYTKFNELSKHYKGSRLITNLTYRGTYNYRVGDEISLLVQSGQDIYLTPDQLKLLLLIDKGYAMLTEKENNNAI